MIIGGSIAITSAIMYGIGRFVFDKRAYAFEDAKKITNKSADGEYGYIEGPLNARETFSYQGKEYLRLDESTYHITHGEIIECIKIGNDAPNLIQWDKHPQFVHRTIRQVKHIFIDEIDIGVFVKYLPLKSLGSEFRPIENYINSEVPTNVIITNSNIESEHLLGKHEQKVIGVELRYSGIRKGKTYTIFGKYDSRKNKMRESSANPNIITQQNRTKFIKAEKSFSRGWKILWGTGIIIGTAIGAIGYVIAKSKK